MNSHNPHTGLGEAEFEVPEYPTLYDYVVHWATHTPDEIAYEFQGSTTSFAELRRLVDGCAMSLLRSGVDVGERVALFSHPRPEFWVHFLATVSIGGIWVGLNPKYRQSEIEYVLSDSQPKLLAGLAADRSRDYANLLAKLAKGADIAAPVLFGPGNEDGWNSFVDVELDPHQLVAARANARPDEGALIVYTSGTTGAPKGAVLSGRAMAHCFAAQARVNAVVPLRNIANLPINHIGGVGDLCCTTLTQGGRITFQEQFDPDAILDAIEHEGVNALMQVPTMFKILTESPRWATADTSGLAFAAWGGGPLPLQVIEELRQRGAKMSTTYGMTEVTGSITYSAPDASDLDLATTVGKPVAEMDMLLLDAQRQPVPPGAEGEIAVKHPGLFLEYFNKPVETAAAYTSDGYFLTGDVGVLRPDGNLELVGRSKEMFKSGGENVYPREIELVIESYPSVSIAAVTAVPHPTFDEVGVAFFEADEQVDVDSLRAYLVERLANYKVPKAFVQVDALPLLPVGKVDKVRLTDRASSLSID